MAGVKCAACGSLKSSVLSARSSFDPVVGDTVRRRRKCECGERVTTVEVDRTRVASMIRDFAEKIVARENARRAAVRKAVDPVDILILASVGINDEAIGAALGVTGDRICKLRRREGIQSGWDVRRNGLTRESQSAVADAIIARRRG